MSPRVLVKKYFPGRNAKSNFIELSNKKKGQKGRTFYLSQTYDIYKIKKKCLFFI